MNMERRNPDIALPFRTTPRIDTEWSFETGEQFAFDENAGADELIHTISQTPHPIQDLLQRALQHPDERVLITAIKHWNNDISLDDRLAFLKRAQQVCRTEGLAWHPLLDAMTAHDCWPEEFDAEAAYTLDYNLDVHQYLRPLIPWLESRTDPSDIELLLKFESYELIDLVGRHAGVLTNDLAHKLPLPPLPVILACHQISPNGLPARLSTFLHKRIIPSPSSSCAKSTGPMPMPFAH